MNTAAFANPFLAPVNPFLASDDTLVENTSPVVCDAREVSYALVQSGPAVSSDETESHLDAVEVKVRWGSQVLSMSHLEAGKGFSIGENGTFVLPNVMTSPIVESRNGMTYAIVPDGATSATLSAKGEVSRPMNAGEEIELTEGLCVTIEMPLNGAAEGVTIEIAAVRAGKKYKVGFLAALASGAAACIGLSFLGHAAIVASLAMFMPKMNADDAENISRDQLLTMQAMLNASAEREAEQLPQDKSGAESDGGGSKGGEPHEGKSGTAGTQKSSNTSGRMAFKGNDSHDKLSKKDELELAANGGFIGILNSGIKTDGPATPWGQEHAGTDSQNAMGQMWGSSINDAFGYGVGLWGDGEGGGGHGAGIGIDGVGSTIGGGGGGPGKWGFGPGGDNGLGIGHGPGRGGHVAKAPTIRTPKIDTNGKLPPEVIQRIVRQNHGRFRLCYEAGLRNNPSLNGRVVTKFVIGRDGAVAQASDAGSDLADQSVIGCVVRSFGNLSFPQPEGGIATVTYPLVLSPGE